MDLRWHQGRVGSALAGGVDNERRGADFLLVQDRPSGGARSLGVALSCASVTLGLFLVLRPTLSLGVLALFVGGGLLLQGIHLAIDTHWSHQTGTVRRRSRDLVFAGSSQMRV